LYLNRRFSFVFLGYLAGKVPPVINLGKKRETCEKPQSARGLKATQNIDENNVIDVDKSKHVTLLFWLVTCVKKACKKIASVIILMKLKELSTAIR
jgi:hypothetical protein